MNRPAWTSRKKHMGCSDEMMRWRVAERSMQSQVMLLEIQDAREARRAAVSLASVVSDLMYWAVPEPTGDGLGCVRLHGHGCLRCRRTSRASWATAQQGTQWYTAKSLQSSLTAHDRRWAGEAHFECFPLLHAWQLQEQHNTEACSTAQHAWCGGSPPIICHGQEASHAPNKQRIQQTP